MPFKRVTVIFWVFQSVKTSTIYGVNDSEGFWIEVTPLQTSKTPIEPVRTNQSPLRIPGLLRCCWRLANGAGWIFPLVPMGPSEATYPPGSTTSSVLCLLLMALSLHTRRLFSFSSGTPKVQLTVTCCTPRTIPWYLCQSPFLGHLEGLIWCPMSLLSRWTSYQTPWGHMCSCNPRSGRFDQDPCLTSLIQQRWVPCTACQRFLRCLHPQTLASSL